MTVFESDKQQKGTVSAELHIYYGPPVAGRWTEELVEKLMLGASTTIDNAKQQVLDQLRRQLMNKIGRGTQ